MSKISGRNFSGKFPGNSGGFFGEMQCYRAKIYFFMFIKSSKIRENSGRNFRKISEIPKIRENFPRKFPENSRKIPGKSGGFLRQNTMIQSENHVFHRWKIEENRGKFRGNFGEISGNSGNSGNSGKISPENVGDIFPQNHAFFKKPLCSEV